MTLTLTDEEVVVYMTMKQHILDMDNYVYDLKAALTSAQEYIAQLEEDNKVPAPPAEVEELVWGNIPYKSNTAWTLADEELIKYIFNHKGKYGDKPIEVAAAMFPGRTVVAVGTELRSYGFYTRKGLLKYPKSFQPKYKES